MKLDFEKIKTYSPDLIGINNIFHSAVCIPLIRTENGYDILFEVRSSKIDAQPGDICLPGGAMEPGELPEESALREICEELLIEPEDFELLGPSDIFHSDNIIVYPFAGILNNYSGTFSEDEVEKVFRVPLDFFVDNEPEKHRVYSKIMPEDDFPYDRIQGGKDYKWRGRTTTQFFYQYGEYTIWGLTAKIINAFSQLVRSSFSVKE